MKLRNTKKKASAPQLSRQEALQCTPVVNASIRQIESEDNDVLLEYPLNLKPFFLSLFRRFENTWDVPTKKLQLDEMGSVVWAKIDGSTTVEDIIDDFAKRYGITRQEAEQSVTAFLVELGKRGIIAMN
ncbi:MAG: PqqD family protein [Desulfopila sp.]